MKLGILDVNAWSGERLMFHAEGINLPAYSVESVVSAEELRALAAYLWACAALPSTAAERATA